MPSALLSSRLLQWWDGTTLGRPAPPPRRPLLAGGLSPEHGDELRREQLRPQRLHLRHVTQKPQHVAVELLLVWKLLRIRTR